MSYRGYKFEPRPPVNNNTCGGCKTPLNEGFTFCTRCLKRLPAELKDRIRAAKPETEAYFMAVQAAADHLTAGSSRVKARKP
ncbi:MAG: hypothetical protein ACO1SX_08170 [Actinomycetota bacterium]